MSAIVPLDASGALPAYLKNRAGLAQVNSDVLSSGPSFPVLSIKGKIFTMVKGGEKKVLTRVVDGEEEPRSFVQLAVVRANVKSRVFYAKGYVEGESDGAKPTCFSQDGVAPHPGASEPQAKKCQACPHSVWGSKPTRAGSEDEGKGTACTVNTRLAVIDPEDPSMPFLLRVPAGSKKNYAEVVKVADNRSIPYNALVLRVGFDPEAPSPRLTFKPVGVLSDAMYEKVNAMYDTDEIKEIVGLEMPAAAPAEPAETPKPAVDTDELDAAIAATKVVEKAKVTADEVAAVVKDTKPAAKVVEKKAEAPKAPLASDPAAAGLLADLDALLAVKDD